MISPMSKDLGRDGLDGCSTKGALCMVRFASGLGLPRSIQAALSVAYTLFLMRECQIGGGWYVGMYSQGT